MKTLPPFLPKSRSNSPPPPARHRGRNPLYVRKKDPSLKREVPRLRKTIQRSLDKHSYPWWLLYPELPVSVCS